MARFPRRGSRDVVRTPTVGVLPSTGRRAMRRPRHTWFVKCQPFELQPCAVVPVAAGDSLRQARFEMRVLTDPLLSQVTGWWAELYWFYVRLSNLDEYAAAQANVITVGHNLSGLDTAVKAWCYHNGDGPDWVGMAMKPIVRHYFRREGEDWNDAISSWSSRPIAGTVGKSWIDTLHPVSDLTDPTPTDDYAGRWEAYKDLRRAKLITVSFPEYLRAQGVAVPDQLTETVEDLRKPELLRFIRQFTYPANTVNPAVANAQVSAASWVVNERIDKRYYFDEPGFIIGVCLARPKVYRANQAGNASVFIRDARAWMPNELVEDAPQEALQILTDAGTADVHDAIPDIAGDYVHDVTGLFVLGDQFVVGTGAPTVDLPGDTNGNVIYPDQTSVRALFADSANSNYNVRFDGMASFTFTGMKRLTTAV